MLIEEDIAGQVVEYMLQVATCLVTLRKVQNLVYFSFNPKHNFALPARPLEVAKRKCYM